MLLADDHALVRHGLRLILDAEPDFEVVAEAGDGAEAVDAALHDDIDLAILDITMPRLTGIQAARQLTEQRPDLRVLILSMHDNEQFFFEALRAGASGYVLKSAAHERPRRRLPGGDARRAVPLPARRGGADPRLPRARRADATAPGPAHPARVRGRQAHRRRAAPAARSPRC